MKSPLPKVVTARSGLEARAAAMSGSTLRKTSIGLVQNNTPMEPLFGTKEARYEAPKFNWLGTPSFEVSMVLLWHTVPVNSVAELKTRETNMGASGANSTPAFYARLL